MRSQVFSRRKNKFKEIEITDIDKPAINDKFLNKWQNILDLITDMIEISAALIMKINRESIEVFLKSQNESNPYNNGEKIIIGEGLYCETVLAENKELYIKDALKNKVWKDNPDVERDMISYYGLPLNWPDKKSFGTICILDNKSMELQSKDKKLLKEFKKIIEEDLKLLINQEELINQKRLFENLFNEDLEGILLMDQDYNVLKVNSKFEKVFGYSEAELLGNNIKNYIIPEDEKKNFYKYKNQVLNNNNVEAEVKRKTKDGTIKYFSLHVIKVELMAGKLGIYAVYDDITARKRKDKEIKEIKERLELAIKGANVGVWDWNFKTDELDFNQNWANMLGYDIEELENNIKTWRNLVYNGDKENIDTSLKDHFKGEKEYYENEYRLHTNSGELKWIKVIGEIVERDQEGNPLRLVGIHLDINDQKQQEKQIKYLLYKDSLTDLYNRRFFEEEMERLDTERQLPISIIMADVNGLKIINDSFGHQKGDELLVKTAKILKSTIRDEDILARQGGDEFAVILPKTAKKDAQKIIRRINEKCENTESDELTVSIALGAAVKEEAAQDIAEILKQADNDMYQNKLSESRSTKSKIVKSLVNTLNEKSNETKEHSERMSGLASEFGKFLELSNSQLHRLSLLGMLHDIGMITIPESILNKSGKLTEIEWEVVKKHPETGYEIALSSEEFVIIAEGIFAHHERWDGSGYPRQLKGENIPYLARIITIVDAYDVMTHKSSYKNDISKEEALEEINNYAGSQFDPDLAASFIEMMKN